ncbi:TetR family transcriptional regulator [Pseudonocardia sp. DSM 110487]|uniref:TetR/AcrR family transcriptional regulator n=1 Tax=Pseudonocardia sp. DSM 110487 TaxID=2865833 RepID=UPI001C69DB0F|nr:TetR family transcriptional regulator [Pseudonocardia sp. DSM 110487]QYN38146.1 TetR family transcriptional regulator [Pseudonocardia sp. DSM 110487]
MATTAARRVLLPVVGQEPPERADAARNRRALLAAAHGIMVESGIDGLTMDRVAAAAGVGVGTVYRRFGDLGGLAFALLDDEEREFQSAYLSGPPPLGPGAPAAERIRAFLHATVDRMETAGELHSLAESRSRIARYTSGAYRTSRTHLLTLLREVQQHDPAYCADALLAVAGTNLILHQRRELGFSQARIKAGLDCVLSALLSRGACPGAGLPG